MTLALAATLVGFVLLVLGLITGTVWLAIACIVVCLIGLGLLIADIVGSGRRAEEPSLTDFVAADDDSLSDEQKSDEENTGGGRHEGMSAAPPTSRESRGDGGLDSPHREGPGGAPGASSFGAADARPAPRPSAPRQADPASHTGRESVGREGTYDDYLRSVGGYGTEPGGVPGAPGQSPPTPRGPGSHERQFPPPGRGAPGSHATPDEPVTESFPPQQRGPSQAGPQQRQPGRGSDAGDRGPQDPRESRTQKFDPLDPNWRPPPE
nr:hypothetical protein [Gordonia sp. SID5947]